MVTKTEIDNALAQAGVEIIDETPGERGGWIFIVADTVSGRYGGKAEAILAGLQCAEELERLVRHFGELAHPHASGCLTG
jgi:hypothetical protein